MQSSYKYWTAEPVLSDISETKSIIADNHPVICKQIIVSLKLSIKLLLYDHGKVSGSF